MLWNNYFAVTLAEEVGLYYQSGWLRLSHAIQGLALLALIATGGLILLSYPRLHWGEFGSQQDAGLTLPLHMTKILLGRGRSIHFLAGWVLVINGIITLSTGLLIGRLRRLMLRSRTKRGAYPWIRRLVYAGLLVAVIPLMVLSGLTLSPAVVADYPTLAVLFGGRQSARTIHFILAAVTLSFTIGHVLVVLRSSGRLTGRIMGQPAVGEAS